MGKHIIEYPLNNGNSIWVETQTVEDNIKDIHYFVFSKNGKVAAGAD